MKMAEIVNSGYFLDFSFNGVPLFYIHLFKYFTIRNTYIYNKGILYMFLKEDIEATKIRKYYFF